MNQKRIVLLAIIIFLLPSLSLAATISGKVYDDSLNLLNDVIITVNNPIITGNATLNTNPLQQYISKDGTYQFELQKGSYTLEAKYYENKIAKLVTKENITITDNDGNYKEDLIVFPTFEEDNAITSDINIDLPGITNTTNNEKKSALNIIIIAAILLLIAIGYMIYRYRKTIKNTEKLFERMEELKENKFESVEKKEIEKETTDTDAIKKELKEEMKEDKELKKLIAILKEHKRVTQKEIRAEIPLSEAKISLMITELEHKGIVEKIKKGRGNILIYKGE